MRTIFLNVTLGLLASCLTAAEPQIFNVWPQKPPGETKELPPEADLWKDTDTLVGGRKIIKLTNVSIPTITLYRPERGHRQRHVAHHLPGRRTPRPRLRS